MRIKLASDTISKEELNHLSTWILKGNQLTKGDETRAFEKEFRDYLGIKYAVNTNSGSSSNLLMTYALVEGGYLKNKKVIAPSVSWVTTVSPLLQMGFEVSLCDCDPHDLGLDISHLEDLCKKEKPSLMILVHVLGHSNNMKEIHKICKKYDVILIEDSCEALGSEINSKKLGTLSKAASFSFYYGHHISTIEGGMVVTNDDRLYEIMLSLRSHGWSRDLPKDAQNRLRKEYKIDEFRNLYTFYYPGFNFRSTDLQAFLGRSQLKSIDKITKIRMENYYVYKKELTEYFFQSSLTFPLSSFAYGTLIANRLETFNYLKSKGIETRPLICGNIGRHPFWLKKHKDPYLKNADIIHDYGIYLPNHANLTKEGVKYVCEHFRKIAIPKFF